MAKVLYMWVDASSCGARIADAAPSHMLGWNTSWAQLDCLKLVAAPAFSSKRLGYLGVMLLLDENAELLLLLTNALSQDFNHQSMYVVGLALSVFGNVAGAEMSRDLCNDIERLLGSSNSYIRKKAALCALRIVRRVPELADHFVNKTKSLLQDRNHGVLLAGLELARALCAIDDGVRDEMRKAVPLLVKHLKNLLASNFSPEHDVQGISDPFLQTKLLQLLRTLGRGDAEASETMNDVLAQVATNTDASKNVGCAILYEATLTILEIEADEGLRVLAINLLGKFLGNRDNNIRYVALNTLNKVALTDPAVQRHRDVVLSCLSDGDISIRRRALELSYALINDQNVRIIMRELLAFLEVADNEFKLGLTTQIYLAAERFGANKRYQIDTVLRVLSIAGNYVREEVLSAFLRLVAHTSELQSYTAQRLYQALERDMSQESLTLAGVWVLGEFGDVLLQDPSSSEITDESLVSLLELVLQSPYVNSIIRQFTLTALSKLAVRFAEVSSPSASAQQERIQQILVSYTSSSDLEIQQRSVEFGQLFIRSDLIGGVLEHMPAPEIKATIMGTVSEKKPVGSTRADKDSLVDLMGDEAPSSQAASQPATQDLLADLFGGGSSSQSPPTAAPRSTVDDIMGLFGNSSQPSSSATLPQPAAAAPAPKPSLQSYTAYSKNGLKITLTPKTSPTQPGMVQILARFTADEPVQSVNFQAAVPKTQQLQMLAMSNGDVVPGATETQQMRIIAPPGAAVRLRLRISFTKAGQQITDQQDFSGFPPDLTGQRPM